ncbi:MAG: radical SAM protein [Deltaproteobacteria bacterium]
MSKILNNARPFEARTLAFKAGERNIFFHILTACNLSCKHCYINKEQHGSGSVSLDTMVNWLTLFYDPVKDNNLIFLGGEPTLHKDLARGIKKAREIGYASVTVDTNGYLFHDLLDHIDPADAVISFSLDGPEPGINDPLRGEGVFEICTANIKKAVAKQFAVSVIFTASSYNIASLYRMPELLRQLGVKRFFIQVIGLRGKSATSTDKLQLSREQWLATVPKVARQAAATGLEVIFPKVFLGEEELFQCAGNVAENFFIFPNGRVYLCPLCEDLPVHTYEIISNALVARDGITEKKLFSLKIAEGCVMNKLLQPENISYDANGKPLHRISCCLLKQQILP